METMGEFCAPSNIEKNDQKVMRPGFLFVQNSTTVLGYITGLGYICSIHEISAIFKTHVVTNNLQNFPLRVHVRVFTQSQYYDSIVRTISHCSVKEPQLWSYIANAKISLGRVGR